jgi:hypothetical protein
VNCFLLECTNKVENVLIIELQKEFEVNEEGHFIIAQNDENIDLNDRIILGKSIITKLQSFYKIKTD